MTIGLSDPTAAKRHEHKPHESPWTMRIPLILLSSAAMGLALWIGAGQLDGHFAAGVGLVHRIGALTVLVRHNRWRKIANWEQPWLAPVTETECPCL